MIFGEVLKKVSDILHWPIGITPSGKSGGCCSCCSPAEHSGSHPVYAIVYWSKYIQRVKELRVGHVLLLLVLPRYSRTPSSEEDLSSFLEGDAVIQGAYYC